MSKKETVFQLVYISFATDQFDVENGFDPLLEKSRENNKKLGITGILLYRGGIFFQLLEGDHERVATLYHDIITTDLRHRNLKILIQSDVNPRIFGNWSMAYKRLEETDLGKIKDLLPWDELIEKAQRGDSFNNNVIKGIIQRLALEV